MNKAFLSTFCLLLIVVLSSLFVANSGCNYVNYKPISKKEKIQQRLPITLFDKIIAFRIDQHSWPISKEDFISKGVTYKQAMESFQFMTIKFDIKDSNNMRLTYYDHPKDIDRRNESGKIELNQNIGIIQFTKEKDQFIWKKIKY